LGFPGGPRGEAHSAGVPPESPSSTLKAPPPDPPPPVPRAESGGSFGLPWSQDDRATLAALTLELPAEISADSPSKTSAPTSCKRGLRGVPVGLYRISHDPIGNCDSSKTSLQLPPAAASAGSRSQGWGAVPCGSTVDDGGRTRGPTDGAPTGAVLPTDVGVGGVTLTMPWPVNCCIGCSTGMASRGTTGPACVGAAPPQSSVATAGPPSATWWRACTGWIC